MSSAVSELDLPAANVLLASMPAEDRIRWAVDQFGEDAVLLSSMQKTSSVLMHMFFSIGLDNEILFGDTGFHFHETLRYRDELIRRYRLNVVTFYPQQTPEQQEALHGKKLHLFVDGQPECCRLRKEEPFLAHVRESGRRLVMNGLRKGDGARRANIRPLARDPRFNGYELHPIFDWSAKEAQDYIERHEIPIHPLYEQGYASIGCACCTTPIQPGEDARAGRWRHLRSQEGDQPQYCGINFSDGSGI